MLEELAETLGFGGKVDVAMHLRPSCHGTWAMGTTTRCQTSTLLSFPALSNLVRALPCELKFRKPQSSCEARTGSKPQSCTQALSFRFSTIQDKIGDFWEFSSVLRRFFIS